MSHLQVDSSNHTMNQDELVVFAELHRDYFDEILQSLTEHFKDIQSGRQGDDWIWIHSGNDKIEIDSFYSMGLEVKGKRKHYMIAMQVVQYMRKNWIIQVFDPPKVDMTR